MSSMTALGIRSLLTFSSAPATPAGAALGLRGRIPRVDQPFDLIAIEEDPATTVALVDQYPVPLICAQLTLTPGANEAHGIGLTVMRRRVVRADRIALFMRRVHRLPSLAVTSNSDGHVGLAHGPRL
jgi:hypothetical protein